MRRAFTLFEVMVAISIVLLLSAILFPILVHAREAGYRAESIAHLRQVGVGIELYRGDYDGQLVLGHLDPYVAAGYIKEPRLLMSHTDSFVNGYGYTVSQCLDNFGPTQLRTSFETSLLTKSFFDRLKRVDPDAALVVDRTHGTVLDWADTTCDRAQFYYSGRILRLYEDTSVKVGQFSVRDWKSSPDLGLAWHRIKLFTDKDEQLGSTQ